jgi:hypothetical protein
LCYLVLFSRSTPKALSAFVKRSHVAGGNVFKDTKLGILRKRRRIISEFIIDELLL